ncbi:hypothetical protein NJL88_11525 [Streptomyces sp. DK15]|uniref:hypothetical protein n=1 Tax=Streptomyces sp. DK15 TaxID=2957499 RepID=UPI0029A1948D|nr:hypothetical protein [Streptomyces sp. DK15]MDX2390683.1 hypothetical protein [Streptomyces sp. DK15]
MSATPLLNTRKALIKAGMTPSLATRLAKTRGTDEPLAAWVAAFKAEDPDLFGVDDEAEEDETPAATPHAAKGIARTALEKNRAAIQDRGDKSASAVAAQLLSRKPRPQQSGASQTSQAAAALLRRGIGNSAD